MIREITEVLSRLEGVKQTGRDKWQSLCPVHDDHNPSLSIGVGNDGKLLLHCFAGCEYNSILCALGYKNGSGPNASNTKSRIVATCDYEDEHGRSLYQKVRFHPKDFRLRYKDKNGNWVWKMKGIEPVPYRLPELVDVDQHQRPIYIVEGEKDADRLHKLRLLATTDCHGAGTSGGKQKWRSELYNRHFEDRIVNIIADNDEPGQARAEYIASTLSGQAQCVKVINLPDLPEKGDVSDWLDAGRTPEELEGFCSQAEIWEPSTDITGWPLRTLKHAYEEQSPVEQLVEGLITVPSLNIVYGAPGTLKSMLLADMAVDVSSGNDWLPNRDYDGRGYKTIQSPVLCIDLDNGTRRTDERFGGMGRERQLPAETPLTYACMVDPPLNAKNDESIMMLANLIRYTGSRLVIIDNLGLVSAGVDENSAEMAEVMANFRRLAETEDVAITLIHHQRKSKSGHERLGETLRGHSSIEASLDLALLVTREPASNRISVKATKTRGADVRPIHAEFVFSHKPGTNELETARFWGLDVKDTESPAAISEAVIKILSEVKQLNQTQLVETVKNIGITTGKTKIIEHIKTMSADHQLNVSEGDKNACIYSLPE